ncbi:AAA family ATPase [Aeromonas caviae]|uniref:AAA family ATPase n=1 Tax=Aeromonas caviae TaxID=648 RepID=UPI00191CA6C8|nr:AAA family ATPase [Aeromonas caviae]MBL0653001.1 AAA family ATPase [Aeromonas caviae]
MTLASDPFSTALVVTLTQGAIDNGYISIGRGQFAFFPADAVANEQGEAHAAITLLLPTGEQVTTCVLSKFGRLQKRLGSVFKQLSVRSGDQLQLTRIGSDPYRYQLTHIPKGSVMTPPTPSASQQDAPMPQFVLSPLNQILFGPPGTGKTYHTINKALAILDPSWLAEHETDRQALKARFDELVKEGRIDFVTFHQSFSYEDFVEGIRAESDAESGQLTYEVVDGVFKRLCEVAAARVTRSDHHEAMTLDGRRVWKMSLGNTKGDDAHIFDDCIEEGLIRLGYGGKHDYSKCKSREDVQALLEQSAGKIDNAYDYTVTSVVTLVTRMKRGDLVVVTDGNLKFRSIGEIIGDYQCKPHPEYGNSYAQVRPVKWLCQYTPSLPSSELINGRFSQMTLYELKAPTLIPEKLLALVNVTSSQEGKEIARGVTPSNKRVLIIDEINRGNVSRIFGELITLIEPSKRAGAAEALSTTLPYSKRPFSVPDNLYLIGTMNTADRSLAGLDIALRRRFVFEEMLPNPSLLNGVVVEADGVRVDVARLLAVMNERIELLLDRDHCLGHAYFMPLKGNSTPTLAQLGTVFKTQILPLLQEYFFEDWQRIAWVLNDHRKQKADQFLQAPQGDVAALFGDQLKVGSHRQRWTLNEGAFARIGAYAGIIEVVAKGGHAEGPRAAAPEPAFEEEQVTQ